MADLESIDWSQLNHAYGAADDIPELLAQLANYPSKSGYDSEPFASRLIAQNLESLEFALPPRRHKHSSIRSCSVRAPVG